MTQSSNFQADVGYSYRASISYIDGFGTRETLVTEPSEIANVDNLSRVIWSCEAAVKAVSLLLAQAALGP